MTLEMIYLVATGLVAISLVWALVLKPYLVDRKILTQEQLDLIDFATEKAIEYAEQVYKNDTSVNRNQLALDYAFEIIRKANIIPESYVVIIKGMIESSVYKLPKTHDEDGNVVI
jgi:hypothetical protein